MQKVKVNSTWFKGEFYSDKPTVLFVDNVQGVTRLPKDTRKILLLVESPVVNEPIKKILFEQNGAKYFDFIFTFEECVLNKFPKKARKLLYGTTWLAPDEYKEASNAKKKFKFTTIIGGKMFAKGHHQRRELWDNRSEIKYLEPWISSFNKSGLEDTQGYPHVGERKISVFENAMFHIAIENCSENNYFTEKLIDCFLTKTVPIYIGCPNISKFFDSNGIIHVKSVGELLELLPSLTDEDYTSRMDSINKNYETALLYSDYSKLVLDALQSIGTFS